ncbi:tetratricopeptide repeat protein [Paludibaculum fermentans]|uniref:Tetratricopeptide repeat protein n=1 Tax=Paludibaculum fermentans TaxID=1473598 RepID=A0A7S7SJD8_PALFE|nr:tetratricopeptide repeat protein [Paludibaculum fermentans]QOY86361.1 tetratricopeptide repeat protein [Paludibaculum fermentans]
MNYPRVARLAGVLLAAVSVVSAQPQATAPKNPKASAYYHAALGHLYAELAAQYGGRGEYVSKAIDNYKLAMREDPETASLAQDLSDLYLQSGQIRTAVTEFEDFVKKNPEDVNARRILARLYTARIREGQQTRPNEEMMKAAIEQYEKIGEKAPRDVDNWLMLGRLHKLAQNSSASEKAYKKALAIDAENEDALTGLAMVYSDLGDTVSASQVLRKVADKNPSLRTLTALAAAYEQLKDYKLAAETYRRAVDMNKENPDLRRAYGEALFKGEDYDTAKGVFEDLSKEDSSDLLSVLRLSQIYRQKRDFAKADEYSQKAKKLDPNNLEIQYNEVSLLEAQGKTPEAIARLKEILDAMPKKTDSVGERGNRVILLEKLGLLYRITEQTPNAVATFREIAELEPESASRAQAQIIDAYRAGKDFASAEKEAKLASQKYPNDRLIKSVVSSLQTDLGHFKEAEATLKSLMDGKSDRETWLSLSQVYEKSKNYSEMAKAIDTAEKLSTTDDEKENVHFLRGAMYERQKKFDLAEEEFRKSLKVNPESAAALNYLGYMLADRNVRLPEALELIKKAVDLEPNNGAYMDSLGWVYFRMNRLDEAVAQLRGALERGSRDPTVHDHLGDVYSGLNKWKDALAQWELALREWHSNAPSDVDTTEVAKIQKKVEGAKVRLAKENGPNKN